MLSPCSMPYPTPIQPACYSTRSTFALFYQYVPNSDSKPFRSHGEWTSMGNDSNLFYTLTFPFYLLVQSLPQTQSDNLSLARTHCPYMRLHLVFVQHHRPLSIGFFLPTTCSILPFHQLCVPSCSLRSSFQVFQEPSQHPGAWAPQRHQSPSCLPNEPRPSPQTLPKHPRLKLILYVFWTRKTHLLDSLRMHNLLPYIYFMFLYVCDRQ